MKSRQAGEKIKEKMDTTTRKNNESEEKKILSVPLSNLSVLTVVFAFSRELAFTLLFEVKLFHFCFSLQSASWFKSSRNPTSLAMVTGLLGIVC